MESFSMEIGIIDVYVANIVELIESHTFDREDIKKIIKKLKEYYEITYEEV
jgi:hypothetical protein